MTTIPLVWFITGCSSGIGRALTIAALQRGDNVIATARAQSSHTLADLKELGAHVMELDVTDSCDSLKEIAACAVTVYGHIDVVVNNAGYAINGSFEEISHEDVVSQFNTNLFGALNVSRAFLPYMREKKAGTLCFIGSLFGWRPLPFHSLYVATKSALRGISDTLNEEIKPFGLRSICIDLGLFRTPILDKRRQQGSIIDGYRMINEEREATFSALNGKQRGDPARGANAIIDAIKGEGLAAGKQAPPGLALGADCYENAKIHCEETLVRLKEWEDVTLSTDYCS